MAKFRVIHSIVSFAENEIITVPVDDGGFDSYIAAYAFLNEYADRQGGFGEPNHYTVDGYPMRTKRNDDGTYEKIKISYPNYFYDER